MKDKMVRIEPVHRRAYAGVRVLREGIIDNLQKETTTKTKSKTRENKENNKKQPPLIQTQVDTWLIGEILVCKNTNQIRLTCCLLHVDF